MVNFNHCWWKNGKNYTFCSIFKAFFVEKPHSILDYLDVIDATKKVSFLLGIRRPVLSEKRQALEVLLFDLENPRVFCYHSGYKTTIEILLKVVFVFAVA